MEQYVRDARIAMIYEGTNGVQAMDLVGRKLAQNGGRAVQALFRIVGEEVAAAKADPATADFAAGWKRPMANYRRQPSGSCRTACRTPTMSVPAHTRTCI